MPLLSVIIPAYNEEESVGHILPALRKVLNPQGIAFEVIFVDDGSRDKTFDKIRDIVAASENVRGYRLSRNFGKEAAIRAGLKRIKGDCCVVMDADLQHPPEVLPRMYRLWESGYEVVEGIKAGRGRESVFHRIFAGVFYRIISAVSGFDMRTSSDFKLLDKRVVKELLRFEERNAFFRGLSFWVGFRSTKVEYKVAPRRFGKTKWGFFRLMRYAMSNIIGFSTAPLQIVTFIGSVLIVGSVALGIQTLVRFFSGHSMEGFTTVILLILFVGGALMLSLGIIGMYIAKIYEEVKARPHYIIAESAKGKKKKRTIS